jgi:RNA polymerase sigma factor for flagellar operon FliA
MYTAAGSLNQSQLIERFTPLVKRISGNLMTRLPASVQADDLEQNGMVGLLDAINRFESGMGAQFETYATQRVRGAMLDGLRRNDWLPRSVRRDHRRIEAATSKLEQENGHPPSETELAGSLGMLLADYQKMSQKALSHQLLYFEDMARDDEEGFLESHSIGETKEPSTLLETQNLKLALAQGIETLSQQEKLMMALYYDQDLLLREIGEVMGISASRVCQLHSRVVARLRTRLLGSAGIVKNKPKC